MTMTNPWPQVKLGDVADFISGYAFASGDWSTSGVPVIRIQNVQDGFLDMRSTNYLSKGALDSYCKFATMPQDVVISMTGNIGRVAYIHRQDETRLVNQRVGIVRASAERGINSMYLYYYLLNPLTRSQIMARGCGSAQPNVSSKDIISLSIPLPPLEEQRKIVAVMTAIDTALDAAVRAIKREVEAQKPIRQALLEDLFSDTEGWEIVKLGDVADISIGRTPTRNEPDYWSNDSSRPFCTIADMQSFDINPSKEWVSELAEATKKAKRVPAGSLLMSFKLSIGKVGITVVDVFPNEAIAWIEPKSTLTTKLFLLLAIQSADLLAGSSKAVKGKTLNSKSLANIQIPLPPLDEQMRIVKIMEAVDTIDLEAAKRHESALRSLRQAILGDIMSGEHTIPNTFKEMELV
jgi:type I restriction enzyme S subunit